jgi:hypothetical protein
MLKILMNHTERSTERFQSSCSVRSVAFPGRPLNRTTERFYPNIPSSRAPKVAMPDLKSEKIKQGRLLNERP